MTTAPTDSTCNQTADAVGIGCSAWLEQRSYAIKYYYRNRDKINKRRRNRNRLWMAKWRSENPEISRQRDREWDAKHPGKNAEHLRAYYRRHKTKHTEKVKKWQKENQELVRGYVRKSMARQRAALSNYYVRSKLTRDGMIKRAEWPESLVNLKRAQLKLTRLCRKSRTTTN